MPQGAVEDNYNIYIYVNIVDNENGRTVYHLSSPIQVLPNSQSADIFINVIDSIDPANKISQDLNSQNINLVSKNVLVIASILNRHSSTLTNEQKANIREYLINKLISLTLTDISSIKIISTALSLLTYSSDQVSKALSV